MDRVVRLTDCYLSKLPLIILWKFQFQFQFNNPTIQIKNKMWVNWVKLGEVGPCHDQVKLNFPSIFYNITTKPT